MNNRLMRIAFFGAITVLIALTGWAYVKSQFIDSPDYIECPFVQFDKDLPRFLLVENIPPQSDQDAYWAFWERQTEIHEYYMENGAISKATEKEREAFLAERQGKYAKAQKLCNEILGENPDSIPALYALAGARAFGETDLTYALYLIRRARKLAQRKGVKNPKDQDACEWYIRTLDREHWILSDLDRSEEVIRTLELIGQAYEPLIWDQIWPLLKLERFDEAQAKIDECIQKGQFVETARNGLIAMKDRMRNRKRTYEISSELIDGNSESPVIWSNAALAALQVFKIEEAEQRFNKSIDLGVPDFNGTAYVYLAQLYVEQGRFPEAMTAMKRTQLTRSQRELYTLQQDEARTQKALAQLTLGLGRHEKAENYARKAAADSDRAGSSSNSKNVLDAGNQIVLWTVLNFSREHLREKIASSKNTAIADRIALQKLNTELWMLARQFRKNTRGDLLVHTMRPRPNAAPGMEVGVAPWFRASATQMVPFGVANAAVSEAIEIETYENASPYFEAMKAELALEGGQNKKALDLAKSALQNLLPGDKLLRARVNAIAGEAARRNGDLQQAFVHWESTLRDFPQAFRLLDLSLPVSIEHDDTKETIDLAKRLFRSPRFFKNDEGYTIQLNKQDGGISFQFVLSDSSIHISGLVEPTESVQQTAENSDEDSTSQSDDGDLIAKTAMEIHEQLMFPVVDMSQTDLSSLDGSPTAIRDRESVDNLLDTVLQLEAGE